MIEGGPAMCGALGNKISSFQKQVPDVSNASCDFIQPAFRGRAIQ